MSGTSIDAVNGRQPEHPVSPLFLHRWSPRAFDGSDMAEGELMSLFEAARWAPSAFNSQPWHFLHARRGEAAWPVFLDLLVPGNQIWAQAASALLFMLSDTTPDSAKGPRPSPTHSFDAGAAWASLALQATMMGYQAHGMIGADFDRARTTLGVPERYHFEAAIAIGRPTDPAILPELLRARETPSSRKPKATFLHAGRFDSGAS